MSSGKDRTEQQILWVMVSSSGSQSKLLLPTYLKAIQDVKLYGNLTFSDFHRLSSSSSSRGPSGSCRKTGLTLMIR